MSSPETKRRVVIADDSKYWREKVATELARDGHEVIVVEDGAEVIQLAMDAERPLDLVIVDLIMPGVNGFEVARSLRADSLTEDVPIIGVTGLFNASDFPDGSQAKGFAAIVEKSVSPDQFIFTVNKYLNISRNESRPAPRVATHLPAEVKTPGSENGKCVVANLSSSGAFLSTGSPLETGTEITVSFALPEGHGIRASARVVWVNGESTNSETSYSRGIGILFNNIDQDQKSAIEKFVEAELMGQ